MPAVPRPSAIGSCRARSSPRPIARQTITRAFIAAPALPSLKAPNSGILRVAIRGLGAFKDRKSTRLNSSHGYISYAVFCLKKKKKKTKKEIDEHNSQTTKWVIDRAS